MMVWWVFTHWVMWERAMSGDRSPFEIDVEIDREVPARHAGMPMLI